MIIKSLNDIVESHEATKDFELLPKGDYTLRLTDVPEWTEKFHKALKVFEWDDSFRKVKDASGKDVTEMVNDLTVYTCNIKFESVNKINKDGTVDEKWAGNTVWHYLTTHPNKPWDIPTFLHGMGVDNIRLFNIKSLIGSTCIASIDIEEYDGTPITNPDTGEETKVKKQKNIIAKFKKADVTVDLDI